METTQIELPTALLQAAEFDGDVSKENARLLALELFREEKVSLGLAARLCATPLVLFLDFAAKHGVPPLRCSSEDLDEERKSVQKAR